MRPLDFAYTFGKEVHHAIAPYVLEANKIMLCWIPKNACTKFKQLALRAANLPRWREARPPSLYVHNPHDFLLASLYPKSVLHRIIADATWKRVAVIRDPMERFISAYLNKAVAECYFQHLHPNNTCFLPNADDFYYFLQLDDWASDPHFAHQFRFCGFSTQWWAWNEIIVYNEHSIAESTLKALLPHIPEHIITSGWDGGSMWFRRLGHETSGTHNKTLLLQGLCDKEEALLLLQQQLSVDYAFFDLPVPTLCHMAEKK